MFVERVSIFWLMNFCSCICFGVEFHDVEFCWLTFSVFLYFKQKEAKCNYCVQ